MTSEYEDFLDSLREAELGTSLDAERVLEKVHTAIGTGPAAGDALSDMALDMPEASDIAARLAELESAALQSAPWTAKLLAATTSKVGLSVALALAGAGGLIGVSQRAHPGLASESAVPVLSGRDRKPQTTRSKASSTPEAVPPLRDARSAQRLPPLQTAAPAKPRTVGDAPPRASKLSRQPSGLSRKAASPSTKADIPATGRAQSAAGELRLLNDVQQALADGESSRALSLLKQHQTEDEQFGPQREAARILALCGTGRRGEARLALERFRKRYSGSVHLRALERSCAGQE